MSQEYVVVTDNSCDLPTEYYREHNLPFVQLSFLMDGKEYHHGEMSYEEFYEEMRNGKVPVTTQVNQQQFVDKFTPYLEKGMDILYIGFSSGLSGTYANSQSAALELGQKYPERKIYTVDTLCASLGQGLLVHKVVEKRDSGATIEELRAYSEELIPYVAHAFTVDDLKYLHRGGRLSKTAAVAGSLLGIKPVLYVDDEGHLTPVSKVRGRKQALIRLVDQIESVVEDTENNIFTISHGDCLEEAEFVIDLVKERFGITDYIINMVGTVIGSHAGPGTIALFMMAKRRKP